MIWVTDFDESLVAVGQIQGLRSLVRQLSGSALDRPVVNMYGGYFSSLFYGDGLTGVSHGMGYGERRSLTPAAGGGLPPARYYLKPIHSSVSMSELRAVGSAIPDVDGFRERVCSCPICRELLKAGSDGLVSQFLEIERKPFGNSYRDYSTQEVYRLSRYHFLYNRNAEIREINNSASLGQMTSQLSDAYSEYVGILDKSPSHLERWLRALSTKT
jgi:hypothetical protein